MVEGTISIHSQLAFVLIDTGAAYSFISTTFAATLPVKPIPLKSKITVASPLGSESELTHYLPKCETIIGGHNLPADLICLDMKGYDAILGVDWLIEYDADVKCRHRRVTFKIPNFPTLSLPGTRYHKHPILISSLKASKLINQGCDAFLV